MAKRKKKVRETTPLTQYLLDFARENDTNFTEMSDKAGLSSGALRGLLYHPERTPSLETCLRISRVTDKTFDEICILAGIGEIPSLAQVSPEHHPDRLRLIGIYDNLPPDSQKLFSEFAEILHASSTFSFSDGRSVSNINRAEQ